MGEIMRWRLSRGAQRRIPVPQSLVTPGVFGQISPGDQARIQNAAPDNTEFVSRFQSISSVVTMRQVLPPAAPGAPSTPVALFLALIALDDWLASVENKPSIAALNAKITTLLGAYLGSPTWPVFGADLAGAFAMLLLGAALGLPSPNFPPSPDNLARLTRWLLVVALVDTLQQSPTPIQTPDDVYAALRWRTLVLPQVLVQKLNDIHASRRAMLVRKPGFADLYITREEWDHYEPAEIASIENILGRELKNRVHILVNQTQVTTTTEQTTTQIKEQDSTTTDLSQLQQQSSSDISLAAHIDGQVDTSGLYGNTQVNTHIGGSLDYSTHDTTSKAITQSHETVSRAVSRIEQTTRQVRTVSNLTRSTDREEHKFDNQQQPDPVVGIYRWVDQVQNVELDRYPHRFLMEFEIPEPGAWTRWLQNLTAGKSLLNQPPAPLTPPGLPGFLPLMPTDITADNYPTFVARYSVAGVSPPPQDTLVIAENITYPAPGQDGAAGLFEADSNLTIPNGYFAASATASVMEISTTLDTLPQPTGLNIAIGAGTPVQVLATGTGGVDLKTTTLTVGPISVGTIPISIFEAQLNGFTVNVEVTCQPLSQTFEQWRNNTYDLIVAGYNAMLQAYKDERAQLSIQQTNPVDANSPEQNAQTIKQELKRQIIWMLLSTPTTQFGGRPAISWDPTGQNSPSITPSAAVSAAPEIQFLEQAFEWETMSYICYPFYWADSGRWPDLSVIEGNDQNFADFLRSGSARVVLAARPGFEDQVNFYIQFGILWGGGPMPAPDDPDYLSIADEIKAQQQRPRDVTVVDTWQVRLPTTLIWLVNQNADGQLPSNLCPTIDISPKIVSLWPASGTVGDSVTITGRNFGDIAGTSKVSFNGTPAIPTRWSANSIDVAVPAGATPGNVVVAVTVNSIANDGISIKSVQSNGMNFTVN